MQSSKRKIDGGRACTAGMVHIRYRLSQAVDDAGLLQIRRSEIVDSPNVVRNCSEQQLVLVDKMLNARRIRSSIHLKVEGPWTPSLRS